MWVEHLEIFKLHTTLGTLSSYLLFYIMLKSGTFQENGSCFIFTFMKLYRSHRLSKFFFSFCRMWSFFSVFASCFPTTTDLNYYQDYDEHLRLHDVIFRADLNTYSFFPSRVSYRQIKESIALLSDLRLKITSLQRTRKILIHRSETIQ